MVDTSAITASGNAAQSAANQAANLQALQSATKGDKAATSFQELMDQIVAGPVRWASKMTGIKFDSLLSTPIAPDITQAGIQVGKSMNAGAPAFSFNTKLAEIGSTVGGGGIGAIAANAGITAAIIEAMQPMMNDGPSFAMSMNSSMIDLPNGMAVAPMPSSGAARSESMMMAT